MKEVVVVEILKAKPGKTEALKKALLELVPICRTDQGCLQYDLLEPLNGSGEFLILMRWKSPQDLARHEASKPVQDFVRKYDNILYGEVTQTEWKAIL